MKRIGIDGNLLYKESTGMSVVLISILKRLKSSEDLLYILYVKTDLKEDLLSILRTNNIIVRVLGAANYFWWEQVKIVRAIKKDKLDYLWSPFCTAPRRIGKCKLIVTIHDAIYMRQKVFEAKTLYQKFAIIYRKHYVPIAARKAHRIITVSNYSKNDIVSVFGVNEKKVVVAHNGIDLFANYLNEPDFELFKQRCNIADSYILGYGSLEKRKNSLGLINAYLSLPDEVKRKYQLVLFGFKNYEKSDDFRLLSSLKENIVVLGYVSNEEKNSLFQHSSVFVFPSLFEGFGIPILEAFFNKTVVVSSNVSSIPEVGGDAAIYINPKSISDIASGILKGVSASNRDSLIAKGLRRLELFKWENTARIVASLFEENS